MGISLSPNELRDKLSGKKQNKIVDLLLWVIIALVAVFILLRSVFMTSILVDGDSMLPTLHDQDYLIANRFSAVIGDYGYGDIITIDTGVKISVTVNGQRKTTTKKIIKRVIGLEGDVIEIRDGKVFRNGAELYEPYLADGMRTEVYGYPNYKHVVGKDEVYVLGDNRANSSDSRENRYSGIKESQVFAVIYDWSVGKSDTIKKFY